MATSETPKCPNCGGTEIDYDATRGDAACVDCGTVLENSVIVAEVGFTEDARGRSSAIGQHVNAEGRPNRYGPLAPFSREATQITLDNGRRRIRDLASILKMTSSTSVSATRLFRLAVERNFHKGRRMANVCAACLYVVCRQERTSHMLIDFSDALSTNVYVLGHTFLKLVQLLSLGVPIVDPSLYIHRFAGMLEFGDKTHAVAMTALRILARMRRDWMSYGRRPAGLCGATIIIAARVHRFYRTQTEVVRVVRIGNVALRTRLREFSLTASANLTTKQLEEGGGDQGTTDSLTDHLGEPANPPAFAFALARKELEKSRHEQANADNNEGEPTTEDAVEPAEGNTKSSESPQSKHIETNGSDEDDGLEDEVRKALESDEMKQLELESRETENQDERARLALLEAENDSETTPKKRYVIREEVSDLDEGDELSELDEADAAKYLNTEAEYEKKKVIWQEMNKEYLEHQELMERLKRERPEEYRRLRPSRSAKKRRRNTDTDTVEGSSVPSSNLRGSTQDKDEPAIKSSSKINYAILETLNNEETLTVSADHPAT